MYACVYVYLNRGREEETERGREKQREGERQREGETERGRDTRSLYIYINIFTYTCINNDTERDREDREREKREGWGASEPRSARDNGYGSSTADRWRLPNHQVNEMRQCLYNFQAGSHPIIHRAWCFLADVRSLASSKKTSLITDDTRKYLHASKHDSG